MLTDMGVCIKRDKKRPVAMRRMLVPDSMPFEVESTNLAKFRAFSRFLWLKCLIICRMVDFLLPDEIKGFDSE